MKIQYCIDNSFSKKIKAGNQYCIERTPKYGTDRVAVTDINGDYIGNYPDKLFSDSLEKAPLRIIEVTTETLLKELLRRENERD